MPFYPPMPKVHLLSAAALLATLPLTHADETLLTGEALRDPYVYLLSRALVARQEQVDLAEEGVDYNVIKYNPVGSADFVNPNLDVAYLEAWIAVDDRTPALLTVPKVEDRYYTVQLLDEWGEVIANLNERNYPDHPHGQFALCAPGSEPELPDGAVRIDLHSNKAKMLARVELKGDPDGAVELQKQFQLKSLGTPQVTPVAGIPKFDNQSLIGVELFEHTDELLRGASDTCPLAARLQVRVRDLAARTNDPGQRKAIDETLRKEVIPGFLQFAVTKSGKFENQWLGTLGTGNYGAKFDIRSAANLVGIWANTNDEVIYFVGTRDADGQPLLGKNAYLLEFPADQLPQSVVDAYWSVILVDVPDYRVVPNPLDRFNFNNLSELEKTDDGGLRILVASEFDEAHGVPQSNWLPAPADKGFSLTFRCYVPKEVVKRGDWFPPAVRKLGQP